MVTVGALIPAEAGAETGEEFVVPDGVELPQTMSVEEMDAISSGGDVVITFPEDQREGSLVARAAIPGSKCNLDPGRMWARNSGNGLPNGGVGAKPRLHSCTPDVKRTGIASEVWQFNGFFWFKASGPFNSYGVGNMEQKSVLHVCTGRGWYPYKVITTAWGTNSQGSTGVGRDATPERRFPCG